MTKFDKLLLALTAAGIWALVIQNAVPGAVAHDDNYFDSDWQYDVIFRAAVKNIATDIVGYYVQGCEVVGVYAYIDETRKAPVYGGQGRLHCSP